MPRYHETDLHALLVDRLPPEMLRTSIDIEALSEAIGHSKARLSNAFCRGILSVRLAKQLIELCDGRVSAADLAPFVITE